MHRTLLSLAAVALLSTACMVAAADVDESDVVVLSQSNFDSVVAGELVLVEFYAPWCGHCKKLTPEYAKAATQLKGSAVLAKLDATVETELAKKYGITGYPTLKIFRSGHATEYSGPRDAAGIVSYVKKQVGPSAKPLDSVEAIAEFKADPDVSVIGFFPAKSGKLYEAFLGTANNLRDQFRFGVVTEREVLDAEGYGEAVVLFKHFDEGKNVYSGQNTVAGLTDWINFKSLAQVGIFNRDNAPRYQKRNLPILKLYADVNFEANPKQATYYINRIKKVINQNKGVDGKLLFAIANKANFRDEVSKLGLQDAEVAVGIEHGAVRYRSSEPFSVENLDKFVKDFLAGSLKAYVKSEPAPPKAAPGEVQVVVGDTFNDIVMDTTKDVLIELYAPWCGHCKKLEPIYTELADALKDEPNVVIAKMDATANDSPQAAYQANGYPTILFAPANNKNSPIKYDGAREVKDFVDWLKQKKTLPWNNSASSGKKKKSAKKEKEEL